MRQLWLLILIASLIGCGGRSGLAPVVELQWQSPGHHQTTHVVRRGETLYAVAFRYDNDFRQLAAYNHLNSPYALRIGQILRIPTHKKQPKQSIIWYESRIPKTMPKQAVHKPYSLSRHAANPVSQSRQQFASSNWIWPAKGRVVANFIPQQGKKGIDIAGRKGDKIHAASNGVVAYAGNGLSGYGNLIIIKHDGQFLTAYGNNLRNRVVEGQKVKAGQVIADVGVVDRKFWGVHFEIRKAGQPVNPLNYLRRP